MDKMNSLVTLVVAAVLSLFATMAQATDFCYDNPDHVTCRPAQQPVTATGTGGHSSSGARAGAAANAGAAATSGSTSSTGPVQATGTGGAGGQGGQGGTAGAVAATGPVSAQGGNNGPIANMAGAGGGATVSTNVLNLVLPSISQQAPGLPSQIGPFLVLINPCDYALTYRKWVQPTVYRNSVLPDTIVEEETALYTVKTHEDGDKKGQPIQSEMYKTLIRSKDGKSRIVECEFSRQVIAMEHSAGTAGFSASVGSRDGAAGIGSSGGATRSFPTAKYLLPVKGKIRQCLVEGEWVNEDLVGPRCGEQPNKGGDIPVGKTNPIPPASQADVEDLRAKLLVIEGELAKRPVATIGTGEAIIGYEPGRLVDAATTCEGKPIPLGKVCWRKPIKAPFVNKFEGNRDLSVVGAKK